MVTFEYACGICKAIPCHIHSQRVADDKLRGFIDVYWKVHYFLIILLTGVVEKFTVVCLENYMRVGSFTRVYYAFMKYVLFTTDSTASEPEIK